MTDQGAGALLKDLKQRGLLDDTLVVWAGEFGRTPMGEVRRGVNKGKEGRDHHPTAFSLWMAGGGVKRGHTHGATDDFGFNVVEDPVHVHDLQATILHLLGIDHERLTYRHAGRDYRLTDVAGKVVKGILT
jgi:arylsulfatase A-like enzyme